MVGVPRDVEQVDQRYRALITSTIYRVTRGFSTRLDEDEVDDVVQHVYLKMLERNFLSRCQTYLDAHPDKSFTVSLITFVRNLSMNYLRDRGRRTDRFVEYGTDMGPSGAFEGTVMHYGTGETDAGYRSHGEATGKGTLLLSVESHENQILTRQYLGEIAGFLMTEPEIAAVIEAALANGGSLTSSELTLYRNGKPLNDSTVRRYVRRLKARVREVAA